jgi:hypothetical protein
MMSNLLSMEPLFHELIFDQGWKGMATEEYDRINRLGMREAMNELL